MSSLCPTALALNLRARGVESILSLSAITVWPKTETLGSLTEFRPVVKVQHRPQRKWRYEYHNECKGHQQPNIFSREGLWLVTIMKLMSSLLWTVSRLDIGPGPSSWDPLHFITGSFRVCFGLKFISFIVPQSRTTFLDMLPQVSL